MMKKFLYIASFFSMISMFGFAQGGFNVNPTIGIHELDPGSVTRSVYDPINDILYVAGTYDAATSSPDFDPDPFNVQTLTAYGPAGTVDVFVATYRTDGTFLGVIGIGGDGDDVPLDINFDGAGNIYLAGYFDGTSIDLDPDVGIQSLPNAGFKDGFAVILDQFGNFLQAYGANSIGTDGVTSMKLNSLGEIVILGTYNGDVYYELYSSGDITIAPDFSYVITGATGRELLIDAFNNIIICGVYTGNVDFDPELGSAINSSNGLYDLFFAYYDNIDGSLISVKTFGGIGNEFMRRAALGPSDEIIYTGIFDTFFDADPGAGLTTLTPVGDYDFFVSKFNSDETLAWSYSFGGSNFDDINGLVVNDFGEPFIAGLYEGNIDFDPGAGNFNIVSTNVDGFLLNLGADGEFRAALGVGNSGFDEVEALVKIDDAVTISFAEFATLNADLDPNCATVTLDEHGYGWLGYQYVGIVPEPVDQPTNLVFSNTTASTITATFASASSTPDGYLVLMSASELPDIDPVDGIDYCLNDQLGTNGSGEIIYVISSGSINGFTSQYHASGEQLFYKIFAFNGFGAATNYNTTNPLSGNQTTLVAATTPAIQASGLSFSTITNTEADLSWTRGDGSAVLVVAKAGGLVSEDPALGQSYSASSVFEESALGIDDNYVIYDGTGTSVTVTGLTPGTTYHVAVYEYNGSAGTQSYLTIFALTPNNPSAFTTTNICAGDTTGPDVFTLNNSLTVDQGADISVSVNVSDSDGCPITNVNIVYVELENIDDPNDPTYIVAPMTSATAGTYTYTITGATGGSGLMFSFEATNQAGLTGYSNDFGVSVNVPSDGYTIPYNSFGDQQTNYRIVSLPLRNLTNGAIEAIFDEVGAYDRTKWRMYQYNGTTTSELTGSSTMAQGRGYWLIIRDNPGAITVGGGITGGSTLFDPFVINLNAGWNLIGNPYNFDINWAEILAFNGGPSEVSTDLKVYRGSVGYENGVKLEKFSGGFVLASSATSIDIPTYRDPAIQMGRRSNSKNLLGNKNSIDQSDWELLLNAKSGNLVNTFGGIGMNHEAQVEFDRYDELTLPRFLDYVEIVHDKPKKFNSNYAKDIVPTTENFTWDFVIESNLDNPMIELAWDNSYFGNNDKQLYLWDVALSKPVDMRSQTSYSFNRDISHDLKVIYGNQKYVKEKISISELVFHNVSPNPVSSTALISFSVPEDVGQQAIEISALDLMGRKIWAHNNQFQSGYHEVNWDIDNRATKGIYIIQVQSGNVLKHKRIVIK